MKLAKFCPICKSKKFGELLRKKVEYPGSDLYSHLLDIDYVRNYILFNKILHDRKTIDFCFQICTNCGFIFFNPRPEKNDMIIKYGFINELGDTKKREEFLYCGITCDDKRSLEIYKSICSIKEVRNSVVIDVGGSRGLNLKYFINGNKCFVVDYEKHKLLDGVQYLCETAEDIPKFIRCGLVLLCHTLEHMVDLVKEILTIKSILEPGGLLYIEVPLDCWNEYKYTRNFLTHINFFSEGSLYYLLDLCGLSVRYLKLKPTLGRVRYGLAIVAVAENSPPHNRKVEAYQITRTQMKRKYYWLRLYQVFLNIKLMNIKLVPALYRYYRFLRQTS
jgi:hypothetical protein